MPQTRNGGLFSAVLVVIAIIVRDVEVITQAAADSGVEKVREFERRRDELTGKRAKLSHFTKNVIKICDKIQEKILKELLTAGDFYCIIMMK